jgi:hypothetical protein
MTILRVAGVDAALRNMGIVRGSIKIGGSDIHQIDAMDLIVTEKATGKTVRQGSDDLRRASELHRAFQSIVKECRVVFAEVPSGGQSARAVYGFGIAVGILASCPVPIIQVMPSEAKMAAVGTKTASKEEMIEWATEKYPNAPWLRARNKPDGAFTTANEHLADACAIIHAGIKTDQFRQLISLLASAA